MDSSKYSWAELLGIFGVIAGLAFVGFELKQSRDIAIAQMYQDRAALDIQIRTYFAPSEAVHAALAKFNETGEINGQERLAAERAFGNVLIYWETNHRLFEMGMLDDEHWAASLESMGFVANHPLFMSLWKREKLGFRSSFREIVDRHVAN